MAGFVVLRRSFTDIELMMQSRKAVRVSYLKDFIRKAILESTIEISDGINHQKISGDDNGKLVAIESDRDIPFEIKRVFYIYGTKPDLPRGKHSHHVTQQYLIAISGSCKVTLDDGNEKKTYELNKPNIGLFQDALIWGEMHDFSEDCVLLVLANEHYDEADYIRDYDAFLKQVKSS